MSGLREQIKDAIQAPWLEGKSGPEEYADAALEVFAGWLESEAKLRYIEADNAARLPLDVAHAELHLKHKADAKIIVALATKLRSTTHD